MNSEDNHQAVYIDSLNDYQAEASRTRAGITENMILTPEDQNIVLGVIGLAGEAGEALEIVKKWLFHGHELDVAALKKETGDAGWYWSQLADALGMKLSEVASANIAKLRARYPEGFSTEQSLKRCTCGHHWDDHTPSNAPYEHHRYCTQCDHCDTYEQADGGRA